MCIVIVLIRHMKSGTSAHLCLQDFIVCLLQTRRNWRQERPGNRTKPIP